MLKKIAVGLGCVLVLLLAFAAGGLLWAHAAIRRERPPLPPLERVARAVEVADGPVRLRWINTATQTMPRARVLDPKKDSATGTPYVMSHPAFVLEWNDGRLLVIDTGMTRDGAVQFGKPIEYLGGGAPMQPLTPAADGLGTERGRVKGIIFSHLHEDHVGGAPALCAGAATPIPVFMTDAQDLRPNYLTRGGRRLVGHTTCLRVERLGDDALKPVPGFSGAFVIAAGGHTPGSQIVVAAVRNGTSYMRYAFAGDIVNNIDGILNDIPKPPLYSTLIVPEDGERLSELRHYLRDLGAQHAFTLLPAHDQRHIEASGVQPW